MTSVERALKSTDISTLVERTGNTVWRARTHLRAAVSIWNIVDSGQVSSDEIGVETDSINIASRGGIGPVRLSTIGAWPIADNDTACAERGGRLSSVRFVSRNNDQ